MITLQYKLPRDLIVACSGGVDSIASAHFLAQNHNVALLHVNHHTDDSWRGYAQVERLARELNLDLYGMDIDPEVPRGISQEEHWRNERYRCFTVYTVPVVTCHHLDDCVETWVWSSMHGKGKIIPYAHKNVIRPFRLTTKASFYYYAKTRNLHWHEDSSNENTKYTRNYIRHEMMPHVLKVNPGIHKVIRKKVIENV